MTRSLWTAGLLAVALSSMMGLGITGLGMAGPAWAAGADRLPDGSASPVDGRRLAVELCADCHVVTTDQRSDGRWPAPNLVLRMREPAMTGLALRSYLQTSHPVMPNIRLDRAQADDVIAYLLTLKEDTR